MNLLRFGVAKSQISPSLVANLMELNETNGITEIKVIKIKHYEKNAIAIAYIGLVTFLTDSHSHHHQRIEINYWTSTIECHDEWCRPASIHRLPMTFIELALFLYSKIQSQGRI